MINIIIYSIAAPLFLVSLIAHIAIRFKMRPRYDGDLDDFHPEFEDHHAQYARYLKYSQITFTTAVLSALALFITVFVI